MTKLKHFESEQAVLDFIASEIVSTIQDDYNRMTHDKHDRKHYTNDDRKEMRNKIHDVHALIEQIPALPGLIKTLQTFVTDVRAVGIEETGNDWPDLKSTYHEATAQLIAIHKNPE